MRIHSKQPAAVLWVRGNDRGDGRNIGSGWEYSVGKIDKCSQWVIAIVICKIEQFGRRQAIEDPETAAKHRAPIGIGQYAVCTADARGHVCVSCVVSRCPLWRQGQIGKICRAEAGYCSE